MNLTTNEYKYCERCQSYTNHWKTLGQREWHCDDCGGVFVPKRGRK